MEHALRKASKMKKILLPVISILLVYGFPVDSQAADLSVSFADSEWTGRNVPNPECAE
jgi:hypothetical protein